MKKILLFGGMAVLIIVAGIMIRGGGTPEVDHVATSGYESELSGTMSDFVKGHIGTDVKCEFSHSIAETGTLTAVTYISGDKLRLDYEMTGIMGGPNGEQKNLHMVSDGEYFYIWGDSLLGEMFQGMKYKLELDEDGDTELSEEALEASMLDMEMPATNCMEWSPDQSLFEIPEDVDFMDLENTDDLLSGMMDTGGTDEYGISDPCATCDMLPVEMQESCLVDMGCE